MDGEIVNIVSLCPISEFSFLPRHDTLDSPRGSKAPSHDPTLTWPWLAHWAANFVGGEPNIGWAEACRILWLVFLGCDA